MRYLGFLALLVLTLGACNQAGRSPRFTLTVDFAGSGAGTVTVSPLNQSRKGPFQVAVDQGVSLTLTASPDSGSRFIGWQGDCSGTGPCRLTMDADKQVTANFQALASGQLTVYGPGDFVGNSLTITLPNLKTGEYLAVIPVFGSQSTTIDHVTVSLSPRNVQPASLFRTAQVQRTGPRVPSDLPVVRASRDYVRRARAREAGVRPQAFGKCPGPYTVGSTRCSFWVISDRSTSPPTQVQISATVQRVSQHAVWFIEDGLTGDDVLSASELDALVAKFENKIVGAVTGAFGNFQDFDNNGKIFVVLSPVVGQGGLFGYVYSADLYPDGTVSGVHSNEGDIFYATTPGPAMSIYRWPRSDFLGYVLPGTMAHELKHLIATGYRVSQNLPLEEAWAEEPSAEVSRELAGYGTAYGQILDRAKDALAAPENFRVVYAGRPASPAAERAMYGFNFLLFWRIHEQAPAGFWKAWVQSGKTGVANLEAGTQKAFPDLMVDWALTLLFDETGLLSGYEYTGQNLRDARWQKLGYHPLATVSGLSLRSMAFYLGRGTGTDATVTLTADHPAALRVAVVRFNGPLPY